MTSPQRPLRPRLALAALLLIPLAALWVILSSTRSAPHAPLTPGQTWGSAVSVPTVDTSPSPASPRIAAGALKQSEFTLLAVTSLAGSGTVGLPTALISSKPTANTVIAGSNPFLLAAGVGTGLWVHVQGGLGFKSVRFPTDGLRHIYSFGHAKFAIQTTRHTNGHSEQWSGLGVSPLFGAKSLYKIWPYSSPAPSLPVNMQSVTLAPTSLSNLFQVTAQALTAEGKALGSPVHLLCQPYNTTTLFTQLPAGYSANTRKFRVTVARIKSQGQAASWQIVGLPPAIQNGPTSLSPAAGTYIGPYTIQAAAFESEDNSGFPAEAIAGNGPPDPRRQRPDSRGIYSQNMDGHIWTGVPTIRYRLSARPVLAASPKESWILQIDQVTPQWTLPKGVPSVGMMSPGFAVSHAYVPLSPVGWAKQEGEAGTAYPSQQRWLKLDGTALKSLVRTETVTFHDADIVHDAAFGGDRVVWRQPETQTTSSGITFTVLNGHPGRQEAGGFLPSVPPHPGSSSWWYDKGNAELLLAWRLPLGMVPSDRAKPDSPQVVEVPRGVAPLAVTLDTLHPAPFVSNVGAPGTVNARGLWQAGYALLRFSAWSSGPTKHAFVPLPRHLKTLSFQITLREQQEQRPFHLIVPVRASPPPGWDPKPLGVPR